MPLLISILFGKPLGLKAVQFEIPNSEWDKGFMCGTAILIPKSM